MLTRCSQCQAWFRVRAEHLSAAGGFVTCGQCEAVFNALETLVEERAAPPRLDAAAPQPGAPVALAPSPAPDPISATPSGQDVTLTTPEPAPVESAPSPPAIDDAPHEEPQKESPTTAAEEKHTFPVPPVTPAQVPEAGPDEDAPAVDIETVSPAADAPEPEAETLPALEPGSATVIATTIDADLAYGPPPPSGFAPPEAEPPPAADAGTTLSAEDHAILFTAPGSDPDDEADDDARSAPGGVTATAGEARHDDDDTEPRLAADGTPVPPLLVDELAALEGVNRRARLTGMWRALLVLFFVLLLAQGAFMFRAQLVALWPGSAALFARVCAAVDCREPTAAGSGVRMLARDVREHPQYRDALLVNATMVNAGPERAPFPVIELRVHDGVGTLVGARRFAPQEYLDDSIAIDEGMVTDQPVYVVIEIGGDAARATSFEFDFL